MREEQQELRSHHISVVMTNNSLIDGRQWKTRLQNNDEINRCVVLSSDKKRSDFQSVDNLIVDIMMNIDVKLPDVIVCCCNSKRDKDIVKLITALSNSSINISIRDIDIMNVSVMFDEVDVSANLNKASDFINFTRELSNSVVRDIHLITATPYDKFWKKLKKNNGLLTLSNINQDLVGEQPAIEELIHNYRQLSDHNRVFINVFPNDDVEYIKHVYREQIRPRGEVFRLFAPPNRFCKNHNAVKDYFVGEGAIVVNINGISKDIIFNETQKVSINDFNENTLRNKNALMYETLTKLSELFVGRNIVITGFNCIERGVTFQTNGFNFTDMIIPDMSCVASAVQIVGRANGGKEFVKPHNIYMPTKLMTIVKKQIEYGMKLMRDNPTSIGELDFRDKTKKEKEQLRWSIPEVISVSIETYNHLLEKTNRRYNHRRIDEFMNEYPSIDVSDYKFTMASQQYAEVGYNKNIKTIEKAERLQKPYSSFDRKTEINKNPNRKIYKIYGDHKNYKLYILKYDGTIPLE
tara:strand:- start:27 stop:1592 length:1566 start_codon:yes stop_codon:yes gene_type:complete